MDSSRHLIFDSSSSSTRARLLMLGGGNPIFRGLRPVVAVEELGATKRPFFTSPDEIYEEQYYEEQLPEKKRRLTSEQVNLLETSFEEENKLEPDRKSELARKLGMQPKQVAVWFQNRRARSKNKQLEQDFDRLKSSYDSLLVDHAAHLKDNERLQLEVKSLLEKLEAKQEASLVTGLKLNGQVPSTADLMAQKIPHKLEDMLSPGSGGSTVVEMEGANQLVGSSRESYLVEGYHCEELIHGDMQSEEDDLSDEGCNYYPDGMFMEHNNQEWLWN
ncbi:homeobox-leucine zipper protein HOX16-like [Zingiber officinale]|uniref:homeobox-leucine zipper protein HOX16-like n=1 Tax=Zingiber officinale TaxID=94328 RepID=UPI001C4BC095|nr:homeobox-leucine zipper protein HOX16-like [Zingiber officinale]